MATSVQKFFGFVSGILSPRLLGNSLLPQYNTALKDGMNLIVGAYGFITARPGSRYIAEVKDSSVKSYLFPFRYSNTDNYILEFTDTAIRFYENQAQIQSGMSPYEISTPYDIDHIPDLRIAQLFDKIFIVHPLYAPRELVRYSDTNWTISTMSFDEPAYLEENTSTTTLTFSAVSGTGVTCTASSATFASTDVGRAIRFKAGPDDSDAVTYVSTGSETNFNIPFFPQTSSDVEVFLIAATGVKTEQTYNAGAPSSGEFTISSGQVVLSAAPSSGVKVLIQRKYTGSGEWGWATITAYSSSTSVTVTINRTLGGTNASTYWRLGAWSETTGYPSRICFYQGRLWMANTTNNPDRVWASAVEDFYEFGPDNLLNKGQVDDDSPISATIAGITSISLMESLNVLMLGGEGLKSIGKGGSAVTPPPVVLPEDSTICSDIKPAVIKNEIIFADYEKKNLYSAEFDFQSNSYRPFNLTIIADHVFEDSPVKQIVTTTVPQNMIWALKENGELWACTYDKTQQVFAWVKQSIGGTDVVVESISSNNSELWLVVKRTINSSTVRYIETISNWFYLDSKTSATFSDSYLTYSGTSTSTITGLDHLEGETVEVIGNGAVQTSKTVSSGQITLDSAVTTATIGLPYSKYGRTTSFDVGKSSGAAKGSKGRIREAMIDFFETDGCKVGINDEDTKEISFRTASQLGGEANPLHTGLKTVMVTNTYSTELDVYFEQPYALPFTIRSIAVKIDISEN